MTKINFKKIKSTIRSYRFKLYALISVIEAAFIFLLVGSIYIFDMRAYSLSEKQALAEEMNRMTTIYSNGSKLALLNEINPQLQSPSQGNAYFYSLTDSAGNLIGGNFQGSLKNHIQDGQWAGLKLIVDFALCDFDDPSFWVHRKSFADGSQLFIAKSKWPFHEQIKSVRWLLIRAYLLMATTTFIVGTVLAWTFTERLRMIGKSVARIMEGDLSERLLVQDSQSETELMCANINRMLDTIEGLMEGIKRVSDNVAHDLRTPLTRLRNQLVSLSKSCSPSEKESVQQLIAETDFMLETFSSLLKIARIEAGEELGSTSKISLKTLVSDVFELYEPVSEQKGVALNFHFEDCAKVDGEKNQLFQMVANLIDNAIKYTPQGGSIDIRLQSRADVDEELVFSALQSYVDPLVETQYICLEIADSGLGILPENYEKVFGRFYREESSRGVTRGNGLGLSLVLAVMKIHSGAISLAENHPGLKVSLFFGSGDDGTQPSENIHEV